MELPYPPPPGRENVSYGIEARQQQVVYTALGEAGDAAATALKLDQSDCLFKRARAVQSADRLLLPQEWESAPDQLQRLKEELESLQSEFDDVCRGKESLVQMAIKSGDLSEEALTLLQERADCELARILDERDMAGVLKSCHEQIALLESDPRFTKLAGAAGQPLLDESLVSLKTRLASLQASESTQESTPSPRSEPVADAKLANLANRIGDLERVVGVDSSNRLKYTFSDMPSALCYLTHQLLLLDPKSVEAVHARTMTLAKEHERLANVLTGYGDYEKKIETLYANLARWISLSRSLPQILSKLKVCSGLAVEVTTLDSRLSKVETQLDSLEMLLRDSNAQLGELETLCTRYIASLNASV